MGNSPPTPPSPSDLAEIESIVLDYAEGWYDADVTRMDRALHDDLVKRMAADPLRAVTKARMVELTAQGGGEATDPEIEVRVDDVSGEIASARVLTPDYLDYLHLVKTPAGWKIANILFRARA